VTNDIAIGIKTSLPVAEELKIQHGTCDLKAIADDEEISVSVLGEDAGRTVSRLEVCQIIEARMRETLELLGGEMKSAGAGMLPAGIILTGGGAQLAGLAELGREVLGMPVRVVSPSTRRRSGSCCGARRCSTRANPRATSRPRRRACWAASETPSGAFFPSDSVDSVSRRAGPGGRLPATCGHSSGERAEA
jgi:cell division ATPase FtsA